MPLELEQKWACMCFKLRFTVRRQHRFIEELGIKKTRVGLTGFNSIAHMTGESRNGDLFPDFATHLEVFGNLIQIPLELVCRGRAVEGRIVAHRFEQWRVVVLILAILAEGLPGKYALGVRLLVDLTWPCQPS